MYLVEQDRRILLVLLVLGLLLRVGGASSSSFFVVHVQQGHEGGPSAQGVEVPRHVDVRQEVLEVAKRVHHVPDDVVIHRVAPVAAVTIDVGASPPALQYPPETTLDVVQISLDREYPLPQHPRQIGQSLLRFLQFLLPRVPQLLHPSLEHRALLLGELRGHRSVIGRGQHQGSLRQTAEAIQFLGREAGHDPVHHLVILPRRRRRRRRRRLVVVRPRRRRL